MISILTSLPSYRYVSSCSVLCIEKRAKPKLLAEEYMDFFFNPNFVELAMLWSVSCVAEQEYPRLLAEMQQVCSNLWWSSLSRYNIYREFFLSFLISYIISHDFFADSHRPLLLSSPLSLLIDNLRLQMWSSPETSVLTAKFWRTFVAEKSKEAMRSSSWRFAMPAALPLCTKRWL